MPPAPHLDTVGLWPCSSRMGGGGGGGGGGRKGPWWCGEAEVLLGSLEEGLCLTDHWS